MSGSCGREDAVTRVLGDGDSTEGFRWVGVGGEDEVKDSKKFHTAAMPEIMSGAKKYRM